MKAQKERFNRVAQGAIYRDVEHVEYVDERDGIITVSKVIFPFGVVLTQDCDLEQDPRCAEKSKADPNHEESGSEDKWLLSVLVAPMYNSLHFFEGTHLFDLKMRMQRISSDPKRKVKINEIPRYHFIEFTDDTPMPAVVIDFKHYFSANTEYLKRISKAQFVGQIPALFREDLSHRFAAYLSRIALPVEDFVQPVPKKPVSEVR